MIDAIDTDMRARPGDAVLIPLLLVLDCAPQHVAKEFRSIMRDTRPGRKLMNRCKTEKMDRKERGKMFKRILIPEEGKLLWKIEGGKGVTRKECKRLREEFEVGGFKAQKCL